MQSKVVWKMYDPHRSIKGWYTVLSVCSAKGPYEESSYILLHTVHTAMGENCRVFNYVNKYAALFCIVLPHVKYCLLACICLSTLSSVAESNSEAWQAKSWFEGHRGGSNSAHFSIWEGRNATVFATYKKHLEEATTNCGNLCMHPSSIRSCDLAFWMCVPTFGILILL